MEYMCVAIGILSREEVWTKQECFLQLKTLLTLHLSL